MVLEKKNVIKTAINNQGRKTKTKSHCANPLQLKEKIRKFLTNWFFLPFSLCLV